jgi:hypothetical protein
MKFDFSIFISELCYASGKIAGQQWRDVGFSRPLFDDVTTPAGNLGNLFHSYKQVSHLPVGLFSSPTTPIASDIGAGTDYCLRTVRATFISNPELVHHGAGKADIGALPLTAFHIGVARDGGSLSKKALVNFRQMVTQENI